MQLKIENAISYFSKRNQKIIVIAYKEVKGVPNRWSQIEKKLILIAMIGIKDIIREGVSSTIKSCQSYGIDVKMLTN